MTLPHGGSIQSYAMNCVSFSGEIGFRYAQSGYCGFLCVTDDEHRGAAGPSQPTNALQLGEFARRPTESNFALTKPAAGAGQRR